MKKNINNFRKDNDGPYVYFGSMGDDITGKLRPAKNNVPLGNWKKVTFKSDQINDEKLLVFATLAQPKHATDDATDNTDLSYMTIGVTIGVVVLFLIVGVGAIFFAMKLQCCRSKIKTIKEQEMIPLRTTGRPLPLAHFRQNNDPCGPTTEEFEKMEKDARNKNISKSYCTAMQFVRSKTPINRYFQLNALDENANAVCVSSLLSHFPSHTGTE